LNAYPVSTRSLGEGNRRNRWFDRCLNLERLEDRTLPAVTLVDRNDPSISPDFSVPPIIGTVAALSPNGRYAVFYSSSPFIVPNAPSLGVGNGVDLFWRDLLTGETRLVSRSLIGTALNNMDPNDPVAISADGRYVAFYNSTNANFIDNPFNVGLDQNDTKDIFRWDRDSNGPVRLVSINKFGNAIGFVAEGLVRNLDMSSDGRYIGFPLAPRRRRGYQHKRAGVERQHLRHIPAGYVAQPNRSRQPDQQQQKRHREIRRRAGGGQQLHVRRWPVLRLLHPR
jgi:hypothetical protein